MLIRIDPKFLAFPVPFSQTSSFLKSKFIFNHRVQANMKLTPPHPLGDQLRFWSRTFVLVGIGSTSTDRFPTLKYESSTHIEGLPTLFHMGCHITSSAMARTWLHRNASLQTQLSAPARLSDLTHSYGQNITVLSRQPTDSKVSALAKVLRSCYRSHG